ncbi:MAG: uracil-DNA glycosylase [Chloroflexi bacterium]|nr:uracil-DNA glycosylase [Chloroflexota bacterium]
MSDLLQLYETVRRCPDCDLSKTRTNAVPGEGPENAAIMFIGEGPGFNEDKTGRPFVGAAGQFLEKLLGAAGLTRSGVYITNVVKCRPPSNRDPQPAEIAACRKYLDRQIELIQPKVVVTLGRISMSRWFPGESISRIHGQPKVFDGVTVVPMFHPAAALHQERYRSLIEADFTSLPSILARAIEAAPTPAAAAPVVSEEPPPAASDADQVAQMRLFD